MVQEVRYERSRAVNVTKPKILDGKIIPTLLTAPLVTGIELGLPVSVDGPEAAGNVDVENRDKVEEAGVTGGGVVALREGRGGSDVESVPMVIVESVVSETPLTNVLPGTGMGSVDVASGKGDEKDPDIRSSLKLGEKLMKGLPELSLSVVEVMAM